jgi:membrane-associated phospholipid phosphatase
MTKRERRFWTGAGLVTAEMLGTLLAFTTIVSGLVFIIRPRVRKYKPVDLKIFDAISPHVSERNNALMLFFTKLGKHQFLIPANLTLIFFYLFVRKHSWFSIRVASIAISSLLLMLALKRLFHRKRPADPLLMKAKGLSFPSGHAIMSVTFYGLIIYILSHEIKNNTIKIPMIATLIAFMQAIGFSRVYLRVHYASDVVSGHLIGLGWLLTSLNVLEQLEEYNKSKTAQLSLAANNDAVKKLPLLLPQL